MRHAKMEWVSARREVTCSKGSYTHCHLSINLYETRSGNVIKLARDSLNKFP